MPIKEPQFSATPLPQDLSRQLTEYQAPNKTDKGKIAHTQLLIKLSSGKNFAIPCSQWDALGAQVPGSRQGLMFLTACESLYYNQFDVMHSAIANFLFIICSLH